MTIEYTVNVYKDLINKYPEWNNLQQYLESDAGGLFKITDNNNGLCIIRYEKGVSNMNLEHSKWFRSVVWNTSTNKPVCVAPAKACDAFPYKSFNEISNAEIICQEFLEGFMINIFKIANDNTLYITSRSKFNATGKFYSEKTFNELFMNVYNSMVENGEINTHINDIICSPDISKNETAVFCSFLVQHKEHRIVKNINKNRIYMVHMGKVYNDGNIIIDDTPSIYKELIIPNIELNTCDAKVSYAKIVTEMDNSDKQNEIQKWIKKKFMEKNWDFQGIVFKDRYGNRWRFRSERYLSVKMLRGNSPSLVERFAQLYTQNLIPKYLEYYSEETIPISMNMLFMDAIIKILYQYYCDLHITKQLHVNDIDKVYLPHLYNIHGIYLSQLKPYGKKINSDEIKVYLHKQPWQRIVFLIKKLTSNANRSS
jgi:hypothetical protein